MSADAARGAERKTIWSIFRPEYEGACDDPTTAPARHYGPDAAAPFTLRRAAQNKVWIYAFGLVFLLFAIAAVTEGVRHRPTWPCGSGGAADRDRSATWPRRGWPTARCGPAGSTSAPTPGC